MYQVDVGAPARLQLDVFAGLSGMSLFERAKMLPDPLITVGVGHFPAGFRCLMRFPVLGVHLGGETP